MHVVVVGEFFEKPFIYKISSRISRIGRKRFETVSSGCGHVYQVDHRLGVIEYICVLV